METVPAALIVAGRNNPSTIVQVCNGLSDGGTDIGVVVTRVLRQPLHGSLYAPGGRPVDTNPRPLQKLRPSFQHLLSSVHIGINDNGDNEYDMGLHIGSIFIIFVVSAAGTMANSVIMEAISAFAYGVVIATGLIHMVNEGIEKLSNECLGSIVEDYESLGLAFVLITLVLMHFIECESTVFFGAQGSVLHGHGHAHGEAIVQEPVITPNGAMTPRPADHPYHDKSLDQSAHDTKLRRKIATLIFEAGVIFHSVIIGLDLGVTTGSEFNTLLAALCFHQFFEGVAIGTSALSSLESKGKLFMVNFAFAITTPVGQVIGIAIRTTYSDSSTTALWVQGILDCVAGGILLYTGLVELLTYNMTTNGQFLSLMEEVTTSRAPSLATAVACWAVLWTLILNVVPAGPRARNHIITLNAAHGIVSTISSTITLCYGLDTTISVAVSLSFFLVDLVAMVHSDGLRNLLTLRQSRLMDYGHHVFGLYWGLVLLVNEETVCDASFGNPYVWIQTNEVSTGFYNWYRLTDSTVAGTLFVSSFFLSRVVFNTVYIIPRVIKQCQPLYVLGCSPFFILQYAWFYMIARKLVPSAPRTNFVTKGTPITGKHRVEEENKKGA
ncbi:Zinc/iron permease [Phytophthora cactorum]|nr:Zinc/iron permease [Phytophthora cactorum]